MPNTITITLSVLTIKKVTIIMATHTRIFLIVCLLIELFCDISKLEASTERCELTNEEYLQIGNYTLQAMPTVHDELQKPDLRAIHDLPANPDDPLTTQQQDRLNLIRYTLLFEACRQKFPDYSDGAIAAAILGISAGEEPEDNPFDAEYPTPLIEDYRLAACAQYIRENYEQFKTTVLNSDLYQNTHANINRQTIGKELLSAHIIDGLVHEFSFDEDVAGQIFLYLQSINHGNPRPHISVIQPDEKDAEREYNFCIPNVQTTFNHDPVTEPSQNKWFNNSIILTSFLSIALMIGAGQS